MLRILYCVGCAGNANALIISGRTHDMFAPVSHTATNDRCLTFSMSVWVAVNGVVIMTRETGNVVSLSIMPWIVLRIG